MMQKLVISLLLIENAFAARRWTETSECGRKTTACSMGWDACPSGYRKGSSWFEWSCFHRHNCYFEDCVKPNNCRIDLYEHKNAGGWSMMATTENLPWDKVYNAHPKYNDKYSSVRLTGNNCLVSLYEHADGKGRRLTISSPGLYNFHGSTDDMISSYKLNRRVHDLSGLGRRLDQALEADSNGDDLEQVLENDGWGLTAVREEMDQYEAGSAFSIHGDRFTEDELESITTTLALLAEKNEEH